MNHNNTYELEFDITNLIRQLLRTNTTTATTDASGTTPDVSGNTNSNSAYLAMMRHNQAIIEELLYSYNAQMQRYNTNIERIIQMLQSSQTRIHQYMMLPYSNLAQQSQYVEPQIPLYSPFRRNTPREDSRTLFNTSALLYTYLYPRGTQERRSTVSAEQRASAIQRITYDSNTMQENVCPISLLPFTQGEQVSQIRHCRHIFKNDSLDNWLTHYSSCCPVCRYDIRNYSQTTTNASTTNNIHESFDYESD